MDSLSENEGGSHPTSEVRFTLGQMEERGIFSVWAWHEKEIWRLRNTGN